MLEKGTTDFAKGGVRTIPKRDIKDETVKENTNMRIQGRIISTAALLALASASQAFAQAPSGRHSVTGFAGAQLFDVSDQLSDVGANFQTEANFGGRYQYALTERWALEGNFLFSRGNTELLRAGVSDVDVDAYYYTGGVVFNVLKGSRITPYVTGGAGAVTLDVASGGNTDTKFVGTFGGGVSYGLGRGLAVRFDVRDFVYSTGDLGSGSIRALQLPSGFDETIHDVSATGGVSFTF